ncbi:hypothetical protein Aduo_015782 [Ancylostoma duodenale]
MSFPRSVPDGQYSDGGFVQSSQYSYSSGQSTAFPQTDYNQQQYSPPGPPGPPGTMNDQGFSSGNQFQNQQQNQFPNQQQNQFQNPQQNQFQNQQQNQYGYTPQYDSTTQYPLGPDGYSSGQSQSGLYSSSGDSHVSIQQYSFNNGDCKYEDGYIIENGQRRQATPQEIDRINQYKQAINEYMRKVNGYINTRIFWLSVLCDEHEQKLLQT